MRSPLPYTIRICIMPLTQELNTIEKARNVYYIHVSSSSKKKKSMWKTNEYTVGIVVQPARLPRGHLCSITRVQVQKPSTLIQLQLPAIACSNLKIWVTASHVGDSDGVPGCWHLAASSWVWPSPALASAAIKGVNQWKNEFVLCLHYSAFQINKTFKKLVVIPILLWHINLIFQITECF